MRLCFAYGSNMIMADMLARCPDARVQGKTVLPDYRFFIARSGYASLKPEPGSHVHGVLWEISADDEARLDLYESVESGLYEKQELDFPGFGPALVYLTRDLAPGRPRAGYMEGILKAALSLSLPAPYIMTLRRWLPRRSAGPAKSA